MMDLASSPGLYIPGLRLPVFLMLLCNELKSVIFKMIGFRFLPERNYNEILLYSVKGRRPAGSVSSGIYSGAGIAEIKERVPVARPIIGEEQKGILRYMSRYTS